MLRIGVVTLLPELVMAVTAWGVTGRAVARQLLGVECWNPRQYTHDAHRTVDDRPFGGGPGMVMRVEPLRAALGAARVSLGAGTPVVALSPSGRRIDQRLLAQAAARPALLLLAGRYEGIDERVLESDVDEEWSLGDFVLSGGELAAMVVVDALARLLPGSLGHAESAAQDSFTEELLDCPHYTRPAQLGAQAVPGPLLTGRHGEVRRWRRERALERTLERRPDLLVRSPLGLEDQEILVELLGRRAAEAGGQ